MTVTIPLTKQLEPYFKIAEREAKKSPCTRRQYGAVVAYRVNGAFTVFYEVGFNDRVSTCCNGNICARDVVNTRHGGSVEIGAEIHAETAVVVTSGTATPDSYFLLVGYDHGTELFGPDVYPCHSCAIVMKFAGYKHVYIRDKDKQIIPVSINEVLEYRINEWLPTD